MALAKTRLRKKVTTMAIIESHPIKRYIVPLSVIEAQRELIKKYPALWIKISLYRDCHRIPSEEIEKIKFYCCRLGLSWMSIAPLLCKFFNPQPFVMNKYAIKGSPKKTYRTRKESKRIFHGDPGSGITRGRRSKKEGVS